MSFAKTIQSKSDTSIKKGYSCLHASASSSQTHRSHVPRQDGSSNTHLFNPNGHNTHNSIFSDEDVTRIMRQVTQSQVASHGRANSEDIKYHNSIHSKHATFRRLRSRSMPSARNKCNYDSQIIEINELKSETDQMESSMKNMDIHQILPGGLSQWNLSKLKEKPDNETNSVMINNQHKIKHSPWDDTMSW
eukprot:394405_1